MEQFRASVLNCAGETGRFRACPESMKSAGIPILNSSAFTERRSAWRIAARPFDVVERRASYGTADTHLIPAMRLVLAVSALIIIYFDPSQPDHLVEATYITLASYVLYSLAVYTIVLGR